MYRCKGRGGGRGKKMGTKENKYTDIEIVERKTGKRRDGECSAEKWRGNLYRRSYYLESKMHRPVL